MNRRLVHRIAIGFFVAALLSLQFAASAHACSFQSVGLAATRAGSTESVDASAICIQHCVESGVMAQDLEAPVAPRASELSPPPLGRAASVSRPEPAAYPIGHSPDLNILHCRLLI